jgi:hypothetical protein
VISGMIDENIDINAEFKLLLNLLREKLEKDLRHTWFEYYDSIIGKRIAVHLFGKEVINQIPQFINEHEKAKKRWLRHYRSVHDLADPISSVSKYCVCNM